MSCGKHLVLARTCVPAHPLGVSSAKEVASSAIRRRGPLVPTIPRIQGFRVYFWSREPSEPPHVHLDKDGASAKVWLEPVALASNVGFRPTSWVLFCGWFASSNLRC